MGHGMLHTHVYIYIRYTIVNLTLFTACGMTQTHEKTYVRILFWERTNSQVLIPFPTQFKLPWATSLQILLPVPERTRWRWRSSRCGSCWFNDYVLPSWQYIGHCAWETVILCGEQVVAGRPEGQQQCVNVPNSTGRQRRKCFCRGSQCTASWIQRVLSFLNCLRGSKVCGGSFTMLLSIAFAHVLKGYENNGNATKTFQINFCYFAKRKEKATLNYSGSKD